MPPKLEVTSSNNWGGYTAAWRIAGGKLLLDTISGRLDGEAVRDEALLPGKKFPVVATWFTGKLHLPIGDYNEQTQEYEFVIVFDIEKGIVQSKAMSMSARISRTWNGR
ncbi:MAG: hypothetical protein DWQ37_17555 [Planctomycetota bacterium]|nr:MAG: hypothetical protein DWQ37_17555 [Planctomycetota bacterium]